MLEVQNTLEILILLEIVPMSTVPKECKEGGDVEIRRGPWTIEEDTRLIHYITCHGEGRWNMVAKCSGRFHNTHLM